MNLAKLLELYLATNRISYRQFAGQVGIDHQLLHRFLKGTGNLSAENLRRLLNWLLSESNEDY